MSGSASSFTVALLGGPREERAAALKAELQSRTTDLQAAGERLEFAQPGDPAVKQGRRVAVVFGTTPREAFEADAQAWLAAGADIFPVVSDLAEFGQQIPAAIAGYNGFRLAAGESVDELAGLVLETLGVQRGRRKVFMSYVRMDSEASAVTVREALTRRWYEVFHDVVSIRPGLPFQSHLFEELADSDVFLLLNSPNVMKRPFVVDEIDFAQKSSIGGVEVRWPGAQFRPESLLTPVDLTTPGWLEADGTPSRPGMQAILDAVAAERTRMQRDREQGVVDAIRTFAARHNLDVRVHPGRYVELLAPNGALVSRLDVALGLPTSVELATAWHALADPAALRRVVYDPHGLTEAALDHLAFLSQKYPFTLLNFHQSDLWQPVP